MLRFLRRARSNAAVVVSLSALASACSSTDATDGTGAPDESPGASLDGGPDATVGPRDGGTTGIPGNGNGNDGGDPGGDPGKPDAGGGPGAPDSGGGPVTHDAGTPPPPVDAGGPGTPDASPPVSTPLRFVVFGDSRDNPDVHKKVLDAMAKMSPELILDTGDLWAGYPTTSTQWASIARSNANIAALLDGNRYLVSRGNHESVSELLAFTPTLVRNNQETYSFTVGNAFFVSLGMNPATATAFLSKELSSAASTAATWRFVYSHYPIYDSGDGHGPVKGIPAVESICDQYHVTAFFSGHEHIYERFNQIAGGKVVDTGDAIKASKGTLYVVSGGGGAPFYTVTSALPQEHVNKTNVNHYMLVDLTSTTMSVQTLDTGNAVIDRFRMISSPMRARFAAIAFGGVAVFVAAPAAPAASETPPAPMAGTLYAPAQRFVATYCAGCHWEGGANPRKKRALPQMRLDSYQSWSTHQPVLQGVIDRWHPEGKVMPPKDAKAQPSDAERRTILDWLARGSPNTVDGK